MFKLVRRDGAREPSGIFESLGHNETSYKTGQVVANEEGKAKLITSAASNTLKPYGIVAHKSVGLPHEDCMMVTELVPGGLDDMHGEVEYASTYETLR